MRPAAALALLLLAASPAFAQDGGSPLDFLKPWLKREILGQDGEPDAAMPPAGEGAPAADDPATGALPDAAATDGAASPLGADGDSALRGAEDQAEPVAATPAPSADAPRESTPVDIPLPPPPEVAKPAPLRFALVAGRSAALTMANAGPVAEDISALLGRAVEFLPFPSYDAMIDAQAERRIDGGFYSAASFALAEARCKCLDAIVAPRAFDGTLAYHAIVVARADSGIASPADLAGRNVAVGAPDSLGTRRMQLAGLMAEGVDPAGFGVIEAGSAEEAVRLVAERRADAAFAWSSLEGSVETGYSRGTLTELVASGQVSMPDLTIVWRSPAIEHGPFALLHTLAEDDKDKIASYFLGLTSTKPEVYDRLDPYYGGGFAPVDSRDYAGLEVLAAQDIDALALRTVAAPPPQVSEPSPPDISEPPPPR